jgi:hypothetical protein
MNSVLYKIDREFFADANLIYNQDETVASTGWYAFGGIVRYQDKDELTLTTSISCDFTGNPRTGDTRTTVTESSEENPAYE